MKFAPEYVSCVLEENFADARRLFLSQLLAIHYAHLVMLADRGIVSVDDARAVREALDAVAVKTIEGAAFDERCEDLFYFVNREIERACGEDVAGRLHTARSRNDIDMTMYRMRQRGGILAVLDSVLGLREALVGLADRHRQSILPLHTHTQPAQPSTVAHYLLAVIEQLERDAGRLRAAYESTNRCPLGACAITGTGFDIDRALTSALLGFSAPTGNTYGSIASVDYLLEGVSATAVLMAGLGRFVQDLLLWCMAEFGCLRLGDGFVQGSSIMPQKRNPVALEHARAICSKAFGEATAVMMTVHNTPFGDVVDTEDDLQPLVDRVFHDAARALTLVGAALATAEFDEAKLEARAGEGGITLTELADTLVREHNLPFGTAHAIARRVSDARGANAKAGLAAVVARASLELLGRRIDYTNDRLAEILSPRHFVEVRRTLGGPAPAVTVRAVEVSRAELATDRRWLADARHKLSSAETRLRERSEQL
jgi:argininosuccinate lyase